MFLEKMYNPKNDKNKKGKNLMFLFFYLFSPLMLRNETMRCWHEIFFTAIEEENNVVF